MAGGVETMVLTRYLCPMRPMLSPAVATLLLLAAACRPARTVVVIRLPDPSGQEGPVAEAQLVILPYDRDSVARALAAAAATPAPGRAALDSVVAGLRAAYARYLALPAADRPEARPALDAELQRAAPRLDSLRKEQRAWERTAYAGWDSVTFALVRRLGRDPFADTTDARGQAVVAPPRPGAWWVTFEAWDAADPNSEWYWNLPLAGDTLYLTTANAERRPRL